MKFWRAAEVYGWEIIYKLRFEWESLQKWRGFKCMDDFPLLIAMFD
jgi:hypothetical protein